MWRGNSWFRSSFSVVVAGALASAVACGEDESSGDNSSKGGTSTGGAGGSGGGMSGAGGNVTGGAAGNTTGGNVTGGTAGSAGASGASGSAGEGGAGMGGEGGEPMGGEGGEPSGGTAGSNVGGAGMGGTGGAGSGGGGVGGAGSGGGGVGGGGVGGAGAGGAGAGGAGAGGAGAGGVGGAGAGGAGAGGAGAGGAGAGGGGGGGGAPPMAPNLYFSEYVEGDAIADAFEIYNASGATVNLTGCEVRVHYAAAAASTPFALSGMLAADSVLVLCLSRIHASCVQTTGLTDISGDDSVELVCPVGGTMTTLDIIGQYGANLDPGMQWGGTGGDPGTQNATLRRRCTVMSGDRNATNAFDPDVWRGFDADNVSGLGDRTCPCPTTDLTCP